MKSKLMFAGVLVSTMAAALLVGCGAEQQSLGFCETIQTNEQTYTNSLRHDETDAAHEIATLWSHLSTRAPESVRVDVESLRDSWIAVAKSGSDRADFSASARDQVVIFVEETCDIPALRADAQVSQTPTAEPEPIRYVDPGTGYLRHGDFLYKGTYENDRKQPGAGPITFFGVNFGEVKVDARLLFPAADVVSQRWTVAGKTGSQYAAGIVETRIASSGLDPMQYVLSIVKLDLTSGLPVVASNVEWSRSGCERAYFRVMGSYSDTFAFTEYRPGETGACNQYQYQIGVNASTGEKKWEVDVAWDESVFGTLVGATFYETGRFGNTKCYTYSGIDIATGKQLWAFDSAKHIVIDGHCRDKPARAHSDEIIQIGDNGRFSDFYRLLDIRTGVERPLAVDQLFTDPIAGYGLTAFVDLGIRIYDTTSGDVIYEVARDRVIALKATPKALFAGRLFLETSDQFLEIDVKSGEIVRETRSNLPLFVVDNYVYFDNGKLVPLSEVNSYRTTL